MIVKDEAANLPRCLESVTDLVDQKIIIDTGSTDSTKDVATKYGCEVYDFRWIDDFAAARNASLRRATCPWVFYLDADEWLEHTSRLQIIDLFNSLQNDCSAFVMKQVSDLEDLKAPGFVSDHIRLFRNHPDVRWQYRVHEDLGPELSRLRFTIRVTNITIRHAGYKTRVSQLLKVERNLRLLEHEDRDYPDNPRTLFYLAWTYQDLGRVTESIPLLLRSLDLSGPPFLSKLYALLVDAYRQRGDTSLARSACSDGLARCGDDPELLYLKGQLLHEQGDLANAEAAFLKSLATESDTPLTRVNRAIRSAHTRHSLGLLYCDTGRYKDAEESWLSLLEDYPEFAPAQSSLHALLLKKDNLSSADVVAPGSPTDTDLVCSKTNNLNVKGDQSDVIWVARLPGRRRRFITILTALLLGTVAACILAPLPSGVLTAVTASFVAILTGFSALWSP